MQFINILDKAASYASIHSTVHHKHSCFVLKGKRILVKGFNHLRNVYSFEHCVHTTSTHAEIDAIHKLRKYVLKDPKKFKRKIKNYTLVTVRERLALNSIPCSVCLESLKRLGLKKLVFVNHEGCLKKELLKKLENNHKSGPQRYVEKLSKNQCTL